METSYMSSTSAFPPAMSAAAPAHFAVIIDEVVVGLVADCSARTATLMAGQGIIFERIEGPIADDEEGEILRMNAARAAARAARCRPHLRLIQGGRGR